VGDEWVAVVVVVAVGGWSWLQMVVVDEAERWDVSRIVKIAQSGWLLPQAFPRVPVNTQWNRRRRRTGARRRGVAVRSSRLATLLTRTGWGRLKPRLRPP
jgi:hypothetical protein